MPVLQRSAEDAYTSKRLGLDRSLFSERVYASKDMQEWMKGNLYPGQGKRTWLAFFGSRMIGAITVKRYGRRNELRGFYILPEFQGIGIGRLLVKKALEFSKGKEIILILYPHNLKSLAIYRGWGFRRFGGPGYHHWPTWPEGVRMKYIHMLLTKGGAGRLLKRL